MLLQDRLWSSNSWIFSSKTPKNFRRKKKSKNNMSSINLFKQKKNVNNQKFSSTIAVMVEVRM